jgi:hypothetical protein
MSPRRILQTHPLSKPSIERKVEKVIRKVAEDNREVAKENEEAAEEQKKTDPKHSTNRFKKQNGHSR